MLVVYVWFFFYCSGYHRYLHSFPTRRSSDLLSLMLGSVLVLMLPLLVWLTPDLSLLRFRLPSRLDRKSGSAGMPRPSSYAVFCLKKKNRTPLIGQPASHSRFVTMINTVSARY